MPLPSKKKLKRLKRSQARGGLRNSGEKPGSTEYVSWRGKWRTELGAAIAIRADGIVGAIGAFNP